MEQLTGEINKVSTEIEKVDNQIEKVNNEIDAVEVLLKKPFQTWTEEEINQFGIEEQKAREQLRREKEQLRRKEVQLRGKKLELLKQQTILLQNQCIGLKSNRNQETTKFLKSSGPLDPKIHHLIPFDILPWAKHLVEAVDANQAILLHGHRQSGKTSALRFIKSRAEEQGIKVYYLDMNDSESTLERCCLHDQTIFQFLAGAMTDHLELLPNFWGPDHFCKWSETLHKGTTPPILLIDEYDAFLKVCRKNPVFLVQMNKLISYNRNTLGTFFSSIVCAGTFSIVATQYDVGDMDVDIDVDLKRPFYIETPWNKCLFIETQPFERQHFEDFAASISESYGVRIEAEVVDDILETTTGHPGFSTWMFIKSMQQAVEHKCLPAADWMNSKRTIYNTELYKTPTMLKMIESASSSKKIARVLHVLIRDNHVKCSEDPLVSFLRAIGIAKPSYPAGYLTFTSPIIRDCLLEKFYPAYGNINEIVSFCDPTPANYIQTILLKALSHIKATEILDPLVIYSNGLSEAAIHSELYRILRAFFRTEAVAVHTECRVVSSSMRCGIWLKTSLSEYGLVLKTECDNSNIQNEANPQMVKYASSKHPREMVLLNFVMKEASSVTFPINIKPTGWDKYPNTTFSVLFVKVMGDVDNGLKFCYASNGSTCWCDL